jgi:hypothetical protein
VPRFATRWSVPRRRISAKLTDRQVVSPEPVFQYSRNAGSCADAEGECGMQVLHPRCAALDLGKDVLVAGVGLQEGPGVQRACRTYRTTRRHLLDLVVWLESLGITHVVMEATGSYWKSVWNLLEGRCELLRELTRTRKQFVRESARHTLRIQKLLDVAGLKITGPISEILGVSGRDCGGRKSIVTSQRRWLPFENSSTD